MLQSPGKHALVVTDEISTHPFFVHKSFTPKLPYGLLGFSCSFNSAYYTDSLFSCYEIILPESLRQAVAKRKAEFFAGRYCAKKLLTGLGCESHIPIGKNRAPIWPEKIAGSISHSRQQAICLVSNVPDITVGVDIESYITPETSEKLKDSIICAAEAARLPKDIPFHHALTLCFSAKESLYKALYPKVQRYLDFSQAEIINIDMQTNSFSLRALCELSPYFFTHQLFTGHFDFFPDHVFTYFQIQIPAQHSKRENYEYA